MVLAKRQKVLIAVFLLGLVGLGVDRVFLRPQGGPVAASADSSDSYAMPPSPAQDGPSAAVGAPQDPSVAQRLDRLWPDREPNTVEARDPFSLKGSWLGNPPNGSSAAPDPAEGFAQDHPLTAVVVDGRRSYVLVNDRVLKLGEKIDGFTLVSVEAKSAVFERQGQRIVLELLSK